MCFCPLPVRVIGRVFWDLNRQKQHSERRGRRRTGRGHASGGRWRFEGQVRGRSSIILVSRRDGREMSVIKFNKEKKKDVEEEEEGQKREGIGAEH